MEASRKAHTRAADDVKRVVSALRELRSDLDELAADVHDYEDRRPRPDRAAQESARGVS